MKYKNGNALISIENDGSRVIEYENNLLLEFPLNIDIRVSTKCSFGQKSDGNYVLCSFCHESAKTNGKECDYKELQEKLIGLPQGIELAIGSNELTLDLYNFLSWCYDQDYICNLTVNQGHIKRDLINIISGIQDGYIKGLGISYRSSLKWDIPNVILSYPNTVFHTIAGIDNFEDILNLSNKGVKKLLILGEKDFGFNLGNVDLNTRNHKEWFWYVSKLFDKFEVVSFDNLALEQLKIRRFFSYKNWETFNQNEHSIYINAVDKYYSPSSRNSNKTNWDLTIKKYYERF